MNYLVIIPTYNEKENIAEIIPAIFRLLPQVHILVVDDSSPDGTAQVVQKLKESQWPHQLHLLVRPNKQGLGKAYLAGFQWGLLAGYQALIEMDADFSHRPEDLVSLINALAHTDLVIGSRYVPGGRVLNWGFLRRMLSLGGSLYARWILGLPLHDWTGGFNAWKAYVIKFLLEQEIISEGYAFQIELKYKAIRKGYRYQEVPIVFEDRRVGYSKMSSRIIWEALRRVWQLRHF